MDLSFGVRGVNVSVSLFCFEWNLLSDILFVCLFGLFVCLFKGLFVCLLVAKTHLERMSRFWPLVIGETIIFNMASVRRQR